MPLCLDTGHLLVGGSDPVALAADATDRIAHTHLKDVDLSWAARVQSGESTYTGRSRPGMYRPLGRATSTSPAIVTHAGGGRLRRLVRHGAGHRARVRAGR